MQLVGCTVNIKVLLLFISMDDLLVAVVAGSSLTHSFLELQSSSSINTFLFASLYPSGKAIIYIRCAVLIKNI